MSSWRDLQPHPAADAFPMMEDDRYQDLKSDIEQCGLRQPVIIFDGMILDGRNRYKVCLEIDVEPITKEYEGDPWAYVWSLNGARRDLGSEQRYLIWKFCNEHSEVWAAEKRRIEEEANAKRSEATKAQPRNEDGTMAEQPVLGQSDLVPVDQNKTRRAAAVFSQTNVGAAKRGDTLAKKRPDLAEKVRLGKVKSAEAHRQMKKDEVSDKASALPPGKFSVLYADPPWAYSDKQSGELSSSYGAAEKHYPSMTLPELKALEIGERAADNSALFIWSTCPMLESALELARAWGFKYKAQFVWDKVKHNMGHYNSVRHELLLICTKGSGTPQNVKLFDSVQSIERTKHSEKPKRFYEIIETLYPKGRRLELFARADKPRPGWKRWGNEC